MGLLTLYAGLLLPWVGGTLWLVFIESVFCNNTAPNRYRQAGYGFFLGYAVLYLAIMTSDYLAGSVSWPGLMVFLLVFSMIGGITAWLNRTTAGTPPPVLHLTASISTKILAAVLVVLMTIHLVFIGVEIFTQPVYPWDAWLAWVYRAKAWALTGSMADVVDPAGWMTAVSADTYTIDAWSYPLFPSIVPYWAALSLGRWSETLVNLPVLLAGLAMGMALYGQCREHGLGALPSLVICYLLYSIPLLGTHLALGGYADVWMAGFTGLGFVALIRGVIDRGEAGVQLIVGLLMVLFSAWVKNEGAVWFLAALAMLVMATCRRRVPILIVLGTIVICLLGFVLGVTHIQLPMLGDLGYVDGRFAIPFIGRFNLELHDIRLVYWDNFVMMGSWNLLWLGLAASVVLGLKSQETSPGRRARRAALSLILVFLATQLFIFGFTDQGMWADTYTAINRLPLHFVPALLFAGVIIIQTRLAQETTGGSDASPRLPTTSRRSGASPRFLPQLISAFLAAIIVTAGTVGFLSRGLPDDPATAYQRPAAGFSFAFGSGFPSGDRMLVDGFENGYALLSSGPVSIQAESVRALDYTWLPPGPVREAAFFWRRSDDAQNVIRTDLTLPGSWLIDLATEAEWQGQITEFGFLVAGESGETVELGETRLLSDSLKTRLQLSWQAWTAFEGWTQKSINFLYGGDHRQLVSLPLLVVCWLLLTLVLLWFSKWFGKNISARQLVVAGGVMFLIGWVFLDIRWTANNIRQAQLSLQTRWNVDDRQRADAAFDGDLYQYVEKLKDSVLGDQPARILIVGDDSTADYYLLRTKYHLLPHSGRVTGHLADGLKPGSVDFVILFGQPRDLIKVPGWNQDWQNSLVQVDRSEWGLVYTTD